ncbi:MAG: NADP-dependent oxidoreductase [Rhodospirillaceae bacterium]|nr:MAG: NADP-dependent oxidoreductase [Rhodospirillaceae bacterium]
MPATAKQWRVQERPINRSFRETDLRLVEEPLKPVGANEVMLRACYFAFDPAQKGWMENAANYVAPINVGDVMRSRGIGRVVQSNSSKLKVGDLVRGDLFMADYFTLPMDGPTPANVEKVDTTVPLLTNLSILSNTGIAAYFGLMDVGRPTAGDTVVISGAAGATGSLAGQIAKINGCRVIGIAGGAAKCAWIAELGFDHAIDYTTGDIAKRLRDVCPNGINVFFDNVGGGILDIALAQIAPRARVVLCGGISRYSSTVTTGPLNYFNLIYNHGRMEGFLTRDYLPQWPEAKRRLSTWIKEGRIKSREDVQEGFENLPRTFMRLFEGKNIGKQILRVSDPELA